MSVPKRRTGAAVREEASDEQLVARSIEGDREAFGRLVRRHQRPLINYLYRLTGLREAAYDLAQEVFIKVYVSLATFDFRYRFTTWLYRIASNCAIDHQRKRRPDTCSIDLPVGARSEPRPIPGSEPDPHDVLQMRELQGHLDRAIRVLPANHRQLILLRHRQHLRYDEIARVTGLPIGTVKNRIFRAREALKRELADVLHREV